MYVLLEITARGWKKISMKLGPDKPVIPEQTQFQAYYLLSVGNTHDLSSTHQVYISKLLHHDCGPELMRFIPTKLGPCTYIR